MVKVDIPKTRNWILIVLVLLALYLMSGFFANITTMFSYEEPSIVGNVAIIPIKGAITGDDSGDAFASAGAVSTDIIKMIEKAKDSEKIKAVIFEINSPGGSAVASEEVANAINKLNKTSVAWIREVGASGAYWISTSTDHIVASKMSATGSIGVLSSYLEFPGLLERFNITYQRLVSGKYKDAGTPFRELTNEEKKLFEAKLQKVHDVFIETVAENRNMSQSKVREFSDGMFFLGEEALELNLIDEIGGKDEAIAFIETKLNITVDTVTFETKKGFFDILGNLISRHGYFTGLGIKESDAMIVKT